MPASAAKLDDIRTRIDEIDRAMHALLLERGSMIAILQQAKGLGGPSGTSAMRPAREAAMMRALAARHQGPLPLAVAERIWREIIAGFTQLQAPFAVVLTGADRAALAELGRYYFGVTTPLSYAEDAAAVLALIGEDESMAGVIAETARDEAGGIEAAPWWVLLTAAPGNPARAVARLPFFAGQGTGPASQAAWVLSRAPVEASGKDVTVIAAPGDADRILGQAGTLGRARIGAQARHEGSPLCLVEIEGCHGADAFASMAGVRWLGGYGVAGNAGSK